MCASSFKIHFSDIRNRSPFLMTNYSIEWVIESWYIDGCSEWDQPPIEMRPPGSVPVKVFSGGRTI